MRLLEKMKKKKGVLRKFFFEVLQCVKKEKKIFKINILGSTGKREI